MGELKVLLVLPAYNEEASLASLLERLGPLAETLPLTVLVVNDGSTDGTAEVAHSYETRLDLECIDHGVNKGLGAAIETGLQAATDRAGPDDIVVAMDADDTHPPDIIPAMVDGIRQGADVVVASRFAPGGQVRGLSTLRRVMSRGAAILARAVLPVSGVRDFTCGYRAYRGQLLRRIRETHGGFVSEQGFASTLELLVRAGGCGARFAEVPLELGYDRKKGPSKMRLIKTVRATLGVLWRARFTATRPRPRP